VGFGVESCSEFEDGRLGFEGVGIEVYRVCEGGRRGWERRQRPRLGGRKARVSATRRALFQVEGLGPSSVERTPHT